MAALLALAMAAPALYSQRRRQADPTVSTAPRIQDVAAAVGLALATHTWSASAGDFNRDGWTDLVVIRHSAVGWNGPPDPASPPDVLLENHRGRLRPYARFSFPHRDRHHCAWGDPNRDRRPDLYCSVGAERGQGIGPNELWIQAPDGTFSDQAVAWGVTDPFGRGRYVAWADLDKDGFDDLLVGNEAGRQEGRPSGNRLFVNQGGRSLREDLTTALARAPGARCLEVADVDTDGWPDVLVCGDDRLWLFRNRQGRLEEASAGAGLPDSQWWTDVHVSDLSGDGRPDLLTAGRGTARLALGDGSGRFGPPVWEKPVPRASKLAVADADGDGDGDAFVLGNGDVPRCDAPDPPFADEADVLLLNPGRGGEWATVAAPRIEGGCGDEVEAFDLDRDGKSEFVVLNGLHDVVAPVQVLRLT